MTGTAMRAALLVLAISITICVNGCSDETGGPAGEKSPYRDLTDKESCVTNLIVSHILKNIERYAELLSADYQWHGAKWGLYSDPLGSLDRAEDIDLTSWIFQNTAAIELDISESEWISIEEIEGLPCAGCWETQRYYTFTTQDALDGAIEHAEHYVRIVVMAVEADGEDEYRIRVIYHLGEV